MDQERNQPYIGNRLIVFTGVFAYIQILFVGLRYLTRALNPKSKGWDDVVIGVGLVGQLGIAGATIAYVKNTGIGYHEEYLIKNYPEKLVVGLKYLFALQVLYNVFFNVPKFAILLLYNRIFPPPLRVNVIVRILMAYLILHTVGNTIAEFSICQPFQDNFPSRPQQTSCAARPVFYVWSSFPSIISDIVILVLPMTVILRMHMETRMKIGLAVTFFVGGLGLTTSILRFIWFYREVSEPDYSWNAIDLMIMTQAEIGTYLICSCLPTYRYFLDFAYQHRRQSGSYEQSQTPRRTFRSDSGGSQPHYLTDTYPLAITPKDHEHSYGSSTFTMRQSSIKLEDSPIKVSSDQQHQYPDEGGE